MRQTEYWHALLGGIILVLVLAFPAGLVGRVSAACRSLAPVMSGLSVVSLREEFWRGARRRRCQLSRCEWRILGSDRSKRRRQDDLLQHDQRPVAAGRRASPIRRQRYRQDFRRTKFAAAASPERFRSRPRSAR